jgi:hypothetical protein
VSTIIFIILDVIDIRGEFGGNFVGLKGLYLELINEMFYENIFPWFFISMIRLTHKSNFPVTKFLLVMLWTWNYWRIFAVYGR